MAEEPILLREFTIDVNTGTIAVPIWTPIGGLEDDGISFSPSEKTADASVAADAGWEKPTIVGRGGEIKLKGKRLEDPADGSRDAGQSAVEVFGRGMASAANAQFKITSPAAATPETITFMAAVSCTPFGGSEFGTWEASLKMRGEPTVA